MRKSFTWLSSFIMLLCMMSFMAVGAAPAIPSVSTKAPTGTDVERNKPFTVTFSESVQVASGSGVVGLYDQGTNDQLEAISVTNPLPTSRLQLSADGKTLTITFAYNMVEDHNYYITITGDAFKGTVAPYNNFPGIPAPPAAGNWAYTTGDYTLPSMVAPLYPLGSELAGTGITAPMLKIKFNDDMVAGPGKVYLYHVGTNGQGTLVQTIAASAFDFATDSKVPRYSLPVLTQLDEYYVRVDNNAFQDNANVNPPSHPAQYYGGINNSTSWKFKIADITLPTYAGTLQSGVVTDVAKAGKVNVTFTDNRPGFILQKFTAGAPNTVAPFAANADVASKITITPALAGFTAKVNGNVIEVAPPSTGWASGNAYTVNINDANYFSDVEFNRAAIGGAFSFTAGDFIPPVISAGLTTVVPALPTNTKLNLNVAVSAETTLPATAYYYLVKATDPQPTAFNASTWTKITTNITALNTAVSVTNIDKDINGVVLASGTAYKVYVVVDDAEPTQDNFSTWNGTVLNVTTSDIVAPTIEYVKFATNYSNEATYTATPTGLDKAMYVVVKFNEPITLVGAAPAAIEFKNGATTVSTYNYSATDGTQKLVYRLADGPIAYAPAFWNSLGAYTVKVLDSQVKDANNNLFTGGTATSFGIKDFEGPNPKYSFGSTAGYTNLTNSAANKSDVPTNSVITVDLGEKAKVNSTTFLDQNNITNHVFFRIAGGAFVPATISIVNNQVITIVPTSPLIKDNQAYTLEITRTLQDEAGNQMGYYETSLIKLPGFANELITFTTADETKPLITITPANGVGGVAKTDNILVSVNDIVVLADGTPVANADANFLRNSGVISLVKVSTGTPVQFTVTSSVAGGGVTNLTIDPIADLDPTQSYTVSISGVYDSALPTKNSANANSTFTIREYTAPQIVSNGLLPVNGAKYQAAAAVTSVKFDEPVVAGIGTITITDETASTTEVLNVPSASVVFNAATNTVTLTHTAYVELHKYHITIAAGAIKDAAGNAFAGISDITAWAFSAFDASAPTLAGKVPSGAGIYPKPVELVATFADNNAANVMKKGSGYIYINDNTNTRILQISANSSNVSITNNVVKISVNPAMFTYGGPYWIEIEPTAFTDDAGNAFAGFMGIANSSVWAFTIGADQAPWVTAFAPNNVDRVDPNTTFKITFNEDVRLSAVPKQFNIYNLDLGAPGAATTIYTVVLTAANTTISGNTATITIPSGSLLATASYEIRILAGAFEDLDGTVNDPLYAVDGVTPDAGGKLYNWRFKTKDITSPVVTFTVPGSTNAIVPADFVANASNIVVRFDETVQQVAATTLKDAFDIGLGFGTGLAAAWDGNTVVIDPTADFGSLAIVTVTLQTGFIKDASGNMATGANTFTAADNVKPTWDAAPSLVAATETAVSCDVSLDMSEGGKIFYKVGGTAPTSAADLIANKTGEFVATGAVQTATITGLTPDVSQTVYFVGQDVPKPTANVMVDANVKSITVVSKDNIAPQLKAITDYVGGLKPADNANCVLKTSTFELSFDDDMAVLDATKVWLRKSTDNTSVAITVAAGVGANSKKIIITPVVALTEQAEYYIEINPGAFKDESSNVWGDVIYGKTAWNVTVADQTAPVLFAVGTPPSVITPLDNSIVSNNNPTITINFNEKIQKGVGNFYIYRTADAAVAHEIINVTNADVVVASDEKSISFTMHNALSEGVSYYITYLAAVIKDKACTPNNSLGLAPNVHHFVGKDNTNPSVYNVNMDGATAISTVGTSTIIDFNEIVFQNAAGSVALDQAYVRTKLTADNGLDLTGTTVTVSNVAVTVPYSRTITRVTVDGIPYASEKTYNFTWAANSVKDNAGLLNTSAKSWTVTTRDDAAPYVKLWTPTPTVAGTPPVTTNPVDQAKRQVVTIEFDEPVMFFNNVYITNSNVASLISFDKVTGGAASVTFTATISGNKIITITPSEDLKALYEYKVTLKAATNTLKEVDDYGVNPSPASKVLNVDQTLNFKVIDYAAPVAGTFLPLDNATNVTDLTSAFEINILNYDPLGLDVIEKMKAGTGSVNIYRANGTVFDVVAASACDFATNGKVKVPHLALEPYTSYYVTYAAGTFKDLAGNDLAAISNFTTWNFATHDDRGPYPTVLDPIVGAVDVPVFKNLVMKFSENVFVNNAAAKISIYNKTNNPSDDGNWVEDILVGSPSVIFSGSDLANGKTTDMVTINPANDFTSTGIYYVRIAADAFKDVDNITWKKNSDNSAPAVGFDSWNDWNFSNSNNTLPSPISWNPVNLSTVPVSQGIFTLGFNRGIAKGSAGKIRLYEYVLNPTTNDRNSYLYDEIDISAASIVNGTDLTFSFTKPLLENKSWYYINITNGAVTNDAASHDAWLGYADPSSWRFSTDDNTAPVISAITPLAGSTDLANNVNFSITFDEVVVAKTGSFKLYNKADDVLAKSVAIADAVLTSTTTNTTAGFTVTGLVDKTSYYLLIDQGIVEDDAIAPNAFAGVTSKTKYEYTVKDNNAPTVTITPAAGTIATNDFTAVLTFSEDVDPVTVLAGITVNAPAVAVVTGSGKVYQAAITAQSNTTVTLSVANTIKDLADFNFAGTTVLYNVTGDQVKPVIAGLKPADGSIGIVRNPDLEITFSKAVVKADNNARIKVYKQDVSNTNNLVYEASIDAAMISSDGLVLKVPVTSALSDNTDYLILIDAGLVKSLTGLMFDGISDPTVWNFRTGDNTPPTVLSVSPASATAAKNSFNVAIEFSEDVLNVATSITVDKGSVVVTGTGAKYVAAISGADADVITMTIGTGVKDATDRNFMVTPLANTYTIGDNTVPTVVITPSTGVAMTNAFNINLVFSEPVTGVVDGVVVSGGNKTVTGAGTTYVVAVSGAVDGTDVVLTLPTSISDLAGNSLAEAKATYTVGDNTAPAVTASPASGTANLKSDFDVVLTFNEDVVVPSDAISVSGATSSSVSNVGNIYTVMVMGVSDNSSAMINVSNSVKDIAGNALVASSFTYITGDNTSATLTATPAMGANMDNTFTVVLEFSEVVTNVESSVNVTGNTGSAVVVGSGKNYLVNITAADLAHVKLSVSNTVLDLNGNAFAGAELHYTVGDHSGPFVIDGGYTPADGDMNVAKNVSLLLKFNETVMAASSDAKVKVYEQTVSADNTLVYSTAITSDMISGDMVSIPVTYALLDNTAYTVIVDNGIVKDADDNLFVTGFTDPTRWNFSTGDNTAPTITTVIPVSDAAAKNVFDVNIEFSEAVVNVAENVKVSKGTVSVTGSGKSYIAEIMAADGDVVVMTIGTGINDASLRNALANSATYTYTIGDNTAPTATVIPANGTNLNNAFDVVVTFSEAVTVPEGAISVTGGTSNVTNVGNVYTVAISAADVATVKLNLSSDIKDVSGNTLVATEYTYVIGDHTAPTAEVVPATGTNLTNSFNVTVTFSEAVTVPEGAISITGATSSITNVGNVYTVVITGADLATVKLNLSSAIIDASGNALIASEYSYMIGDHTAPTATVLPTTGADLKNSFNVIVTFSEAVVVPNGAISVTGGTATITNVGMVYNVAISGTDMSTVKLNLSSTITDASANANALVASEYSYTVGDNTAPTAIVEAASGTNLKNAFNVKVTFSEAVIVPNGAISVTGGTATITNVGLVYTVAITGDDLATVKLKLSSAITDASVSANALVASEYTYMIGDNTTPKLVTVNPNGGATENAHPANFEMFVDESVVKGAGKLTVYKKVGDVKTMELDASTVVITAVGTTYKVTIPLTNSLDKNTDYYVLVSDGFVVDGNANKLAAVDSKTYWTFKTGDFKTAIEPSASLEFKVYPNPFVDYVNVENASLLSKIVVTNIAGQTVKQVVNPTDRIQLNELRSGVYFMSMYDMDNVVKGTAKIVKR